MGIFCTLIIFTIWLQTERPTGFRRYLKQWLRNELISVDRLPPDKIIDAIYILGGSQKSLEYKFKRAADLYNSGVYKKILILHHPGITEYNPSLERNLTNDQWAILKLEELGIPEKKIEAISIKEGFFGTFAEAKGVSKLIMERGYKSIILLSSPYHTHRVKISFDNFLKNQDVSVYACPACPMKSESHFIGVKFFKKDSGADLSAGTVADLTGVQGSDKRVFLRHLMIEFIKLKVYEYFLIS